MPTCKEVTRAIASDELATAGRLRRGAVRMHLLRGRHCRRYAAQIRAIGMAVAHDETTRSGTPAEPSLFVHSRGDLERGVGRRMRRT